MKRTKREINGVLIKYKSHPCRRFMSFNQLVGQGCPTSGPHKVLVRPSDNFQFTGYNEGYEEEFREIAERHLGPKSITERRF